jgi:hypothetical protein
MKPFTFAELWEMETVKPEWLIATMSDYAHSGAGIWASGVAEIFDRTPMSRRQMKRVRFLAKSGISVQERLGQSMDAGAYRAVHDHANLRLRETLKL